MRVLVADHPLITHKLTVLRDKETNSQVFRHLVEEPGVVVDPHQPARIEHGARTVVDFRILDDQIEHVFFLPD